MQLKNGFTLLATITDVCLSSNLGPTTVQITTLVLAALLSSGTPAERFHVRENCAAGTVVGTVQTEGQGKATFSITSGNEAGLFRIDASTGQITVIGNLDFEQQREFPLTITVTRPANIKDDLAAGFAEELKKSGINFSQKKGSGNDADVRVVSVEVTDVNERPDITDQILRVAENHDSRTIIGRIRATDPDANEELSFAILGDNVKNILEIDPATGAISVRKGAVLDFETQPTLEFDVAVIDRAGLIETARVNLELTNVNEPPQLASQTWNLPENSKVDTVVGRVHATDPDAGDSARYEIVGGNDNGTFAIDSNTGEITVRDNALLDYESADEYLLWVAVSDSSGATSTAEFPIHLINSNESPIAVSQTFKLPSKPRADTVIGRVIATDPDLDDNLTFAITGGNAASAFQIDATTGEIKLTDVKQIRSLKEKTTALEITITDQQGASSTFQAEIDLAAAIRPATATTLATNTKKPRKTRAVSKGAQAMAAAIADGPDQPEPPSDSGLLDHAFSYGGWLIATVLGGTWLVTRKRIKREEKTRRKSLKALERERAQIQERLQEFEGLQAEVVAEKNEVLAVQTMLTREFEKLRKLLEEYQGELQSTGSVLLETHELLIEGATAVTNQTKSITNGESSQTEFSKALGAAQRDLTKQQQRLENVQKSMVKRDQDLGATCSAMDARLEEIMERVAAANSGNNEDLFLLDEDLPQPSDDILDDFSDAADVQVDQDHPQAEEVASKPAHPSELEANAAHETVAVEDQAEDDADDDTIFLDQSDRWAARTEMDTLRAVANKSAKSALKAHARKSLWKTKLLLGMMSAMSFVAAVCLLSGGLGNGIAIESCGWGAAAVGAIAVVHLIQKTLQTR